MDAQARKEFGLYLKELRFLARLSLREAEKATGNTVSNAYISQLESGKIETPSPHVLDKLATVYGVPHRDMMEATGYIKRVGGDKTGVPSAIPFLRKQDLTREEREETIRFLEFLRLRKRKKMHEK